MSDTITEPRPGAGEGSAGLGDGGGPEAQLDERVARALRDAGESWETRDRGDDHLDVDPDLSRVQLRQSARRGDRYVRVHRSQSELFDRAAPGVLVAKQRGAPARGRLRRLLHRLRIFLLGQPLASHEALHERLTKVKALAVLSSDALSSVAYATEQILVVLIAAGSGMLSYSLPIMGMILFLLAAVVLSYRQTIRAYPRGGGSYIVASDNLGPLAGLIAGSALMTDYVLTVAVSVSSGLQTALSAFPGAQPYIVPIAVGVVMLIVLGNLRGIRESGTIFAAPTYLFIIAVAAMLLTLVVKAATGSLHQVAAPDNPLRPAAESLGLFLVLRAFASGCTALTGVEAISDGVPAFKPPEWRNARTTLTAMGLILGLTFLGITVFSHALGLIPQDPASDHYQTVVSQLAAATFGSTGFLYLLVIVSTTGILILAANTSFSDFPRLFFFMARDDYAPHLFKRLGERLAYSNGIIVLGVLASLLIVVFKANTDALIPLYTIGVFLAFTMSQAGMVVRHLRIKEQGWRAGLAMNALGMSLTAVVFLVTAYVKFTEGAFIVVLIIPVLVMIFFAVHRHYTDVDSHLATETSISPAGVRPICIVPIADLNALALQSLAFAKSIADTVIAVHVSDDEADVARLHAKWEAWGKHVPLEIIESPYRALVRPLLLYIDALERQQRDATIVVVLPEMVATRWWHQVLHNQTALRLKAALLFRPGTVTINVPYHLRRVPRARRRARVRDGALDEL